MNVDLRDAIAKAIFDETNLTSYGACRAAEAVLALPALAALLPAGVPQPPDAPDDISDTTSHRRSS